MLRAVCSFSLFSGIVIDSWLKHQDPIGPEPKDAANQTGKKISFAADSCFNYLKGVINHSGTYRNYLWESYSGLRNLYILDDSRTEREFENRKGLEKEVITFADGQGIIDYPDGSHYEGGVENRIPEGNGIMCDPDGTYFKAEFKNGIPTGKFIQCYKDGHRCEGEIKNGKIIVERSILHYPGVLRLEEKYENNKPSGKAIIDYKSGFRYEGEVKNGIPDGKGILDYKGGFRYEGEFKNGNPLGKGTCYYPDGSQREVNYS